MTIPSAMIQWSLIGSIIGPLTLPSPPHGRGCDARLDLTASSSPAAANGLAKKAIAPAAVAALRVSADG